MYPISAYTLALEIMIIKMVLTRRQNEAFFLSNHLACLCSICMLFVCFKLKFVKVLNDCRFYCKQKLPYYYMNQNT